MKIDLLNKVGNGVEPINKTKSVVLHDQKKDLQVYKINLNLLNYNTKNGRISSQINEHESNTGIELNKEYNDSSSELNDLIERFIIDSNKTAFKATKNSIDNFGQHETGVVLHDGTVIDGNRRFTCLRVLSKENSKKIEPLFFEAIILPENITKKEIKQLELQIQHATEEKVDYDVMDKIIDVYKYIKVEKELTVEEYAKNSNWDKQKINEYIETYELIDDYLESIQSKGKLYLATNWKLQGPMREIWLILKKINNITDKNKTKHILFNLIKISSSGDLTRVIRDYGKTLLTMSQNDGEESIKIFEKLNNLDEKFDDMYDKSLPVNENLANIRSSKYAAEFKENLETHGENLRFKSEKKLEKVKIERIYEMINSIDLKKVEISSKEVKRDIIDICEKIENKLIEIKSNAEKS